MCAVDLLVLIAVISLVVEGLVVVRWLVGCEVVLLELIPLDQLLVMLNDTLRKAFLEGVELL